MARRQCWKPGPHPGGRKGKGSKGARDKGKGLLFERFNSQPARSRALEEHTPENYLGELAPTKDKQVKQNWVERVQFTK